MRADLIATRQDLLQGQRHPKEVAETSLEIAQSSACKHAILNLTPAEAMRSALHPQSLQQPLSGLAVSIKDLFDVRGQISTAGSIVLGTRPPALNDAVAVARLRRAGASFIGRTNMVEFAFSGVGINPHHSTPAAWDALSDTSVGVVGAPHIPGGSSSGAAVSVATGAAFIGLGSDTGGSIRIPAALNGIVGFKNTARLTPTQGTIPLSSTLDTVCALTRTVRDTILAHEILSARTVPRAQRPLTDYRLAVVNHLMQNNLDPIVSQTFERALVRLRAAGARITEINLPQLDELGALMATGGFSAPESFAWHKSLLEHDRDRYDPRVAQRIERGGTMSAHEYIQLHTVRNDWIQRMESALTGYDAVLSPTTPITAPQISTVAPGTERDEEFFRVNALMLRNTSAVNTFDGCGISLPCHIPGDMPVGLMAWHGAMHDDTILQLALLLEPLLQVP